jgi:hypothetical protein
MPVPWPVFASVTRPFLVTNTSPPVSASNSVSPMRWCSVPQYELGLRQNKLPSTNQAKYQDRLVTAQ